MAQPIGPVPDKLVPDHLVPDHLVKVAFVTQGCKLNQADSRQLARQFEEAGYVIVEPRSQGGQDPDVVVVNSCTVTSVADGKARQALRAAKRSNPGALVVAAGCYAERSPRELSSMEDVSLVVGNSRKRELVPLVTSALASRGVAAPAPLHTHNGPSAPEPAGEVLQFSPGRGRAQPGNRARAMIKIQEGCDQVCAYCIVPKVRGRERSIPPDDLVAQIRECQHQGRQDQSHGRQGCQEVVLTGTQLGTYGFDLPGQSLRSLLEKVLEETTVPRVRVSSLQPQEFSPELLGLWQDSRLCPHFHIPLQSGSGPILRAMRRRYDTAGFAAAVDLVRQTVPDAGISTDVIVGFPGESAELFQESLDFAASMAFSAMHVFPYSPRPGTSAFYLKDQVSSQAKKERMARMLAQAQEGAERFRRSNLGRVYPVLWEGEEARSSGESGARTWRGLTPNYLKVHCSSSADLGNVILPAKLVAETDGRLLARTLEA